MPPGYVSVAGRARLAMRLLAVAVVLDLVAVAFDVLELRLLGRLEAGEAVSDAELDASASRQATIGALQIGALVVTGVFFIAWFHRAYKNLPALGATALRWKTWWAIGGWLIPIANLFRPKQIANDIWRESDPAAPPTSYDSRQRPLPGILLAWWSLFLISGFAGRLASGAERGAESVDRFQNVAIGWLLADSSSAAAGVLALLVVRRTTARQEERAARLAAG
jgi:hypothetical protein